MKKIFSFKKSELNSFMRLYNIANIKFGYNGVKITYLDSLKFEYLSYFKFSKKYREFLNL